MIKKSLEVLYKQQYNRNLYIYQYDFHDISSENYWKQFEVPYRELNTYGLLELLKKVRRDWSEISDTDNDNYSEKLTNIIIALKSELATREHIPNKKERDKIRKEKFIDKKNGYSK